MFLGDAKAGSVRPPALNAFQNGVNTLYGSPFLVASVCGSRIKAELKLSASTPRLLSWFFTRSFRAIAQGSYRRFQ